jgi:SP family arabinose:H+ symporter-like MFS transporter
MQAVLVGIVNLLATVVAIMLIDRLGRRPLLIAGLTIIAVSMSVLAYSFYTASYGPGGELIEMNATMVLIAILSFVLGFGISLGPVMWVLFSELFPNRLRGLAISFCGLINSSVSFVVQLVFPWELENLGPASTFLIYGSFAIVGLFFIMRILPETKGRSLERLEAELVTQKQ